MGVNSLDKIAERASSWVDLELEPIPEVIQTPFGQQIHLCLPSGELPESVYFESVALKTIRVDWREPFHSNPFVDWIVRASLIDDLQARVCPTDQPVLRRVIAKLSCDSRQPEIVASRLFDLAKSSKPTRQNTEKYLAFQKLKRVYHWGLAEGLPGFEEHYAQALSDMTASSNGCSEQFVSMEDVLEGPFTRSEIHLIELAMDKSPQVSLRQRGAFLLARDWGLRPIQMALITDVDVGEDELGPFVLIASVKGEHRSRLRRWRSNMVKRYIADDTFDVLKRLTEESRIFVGPLRDQVRRFVGTYADELQVPLFPIRSRSPEAIQRMVSDPSLMPFVLHSHSQSVGNDVLSLTHVLRVPNPRSQLLQDPDAILRISCQRLRRTKGTSMVLSGSSIEDVAEALDHSNTESVRHYFRYNRDLHRLVNEASLSNPDVQAAVRMWEGRIETTETSKSRAVVGSLGGCNYEGACPHHPTVSCYACSAFRPWRDANHGDSQRSIDSLARHIAANSTGPISQQLGAAAYGVRSLILALEIEGAM